MIELKSIARTYASAGGGFAALRGIDLEIPHGTFTGIVGKSGSGKSTLLNILTGIDRPDAGSVVINGVDLGTLNETECARWRGRTIGIVFQFFQLIPTLTVIENVLLAMDLVRVIPKRARRARAMSLLKQVAIEEHARKFPAALSGGEQQRAAIARALANDPPILVADEPTGNLDSATTKVVLELFRQLVTEGKTVIVVTHDVSACASFERVITLKDGVIENDQQNRLPANEILPSHEYAAEESIQ